MVKAIVMPKLGTTMKVGVLTAWHKQPGQRVAAGELLMTVESNKAQVDIDATASGYLVAQLYGAGAEVAVTEVLGYLADSPDEAPPVAQSAGEAPAIGAAPPKTAPAAPPAAADESGARAGKVKASPRAKAMAQQAGLRLEDIEGTGLGGMVSAEDVERAMAAGLSAAPAAPAAKAGGARPLQGMRRAIAENMLKSVQTMAQAYHWLQVDMAAVNAARAKLAADGQSVSLNSFLLLAAARALSEWPAMNGTLTEEGLTTYAQVNLGVAVALEEGLIVPNIKNAQEKNLLALQAEAAQLAQCARAGGLSPEQYRGGTFTVTNLGMYGLEGFFAIVNPPEVGILAAGQVADEAVALNGELCIRPRMHLALTYDHRAVDGAVAAQFLARVRALLETPSLML